MITHPAFFMTFFFVANCQNKTVILLRRNDLTDKSSELTRREIGYFSKNIQFFSFQIIE